ncbi:MAG: hypothetical protein AB9880_07905 [Christensenellales bacterium]
MAGQLWVRLVKGAKILKDVVVPCPAADWQEALREACHKLDLSVPIQVPRHLRDWEAYRQTRYLPEHFMDGLRFDRMEVEYFDADQGAARKRSDDPRNG